MFTVPVSKFVVSFCCEIYRNQAHVIVVVVVVIKLDMP